jgi:hypothetical protein
VKGRKLDVLTESIDAHRKTGDGKLMLVYSQQGILCFDYRWVEIETRSRVSNVYQTAHEAYSWANGYDEACAINQISGETIEGE